MTKEQRIAQLERLLREAVKIVHCHARNTDKDWLARARAALRKPTAPPSKAARGFCYCVCEKKELAHGQRGYYCMRCDKEPHPDDY